MGTIVFISLLILNPDMNLGAGEIVIDFSSRADIRYNGNEIEIRQGRLRLSPAGWFWTNTAGISGYSIPNFLYQDTNGDLFYSCSHFSASGCLYRSADYGRTWRTVFPRRAVSSIIRAADGNLYGTAVNAEGLIASSDNGESWNNIFPAKHCGAVMESKTRSLIFYQYDDRFSPVIWYSNYVLRSADYGKSWSVMYKDDLPSGNGFYWIYELEDGTLVSARAFGLFRSRDNAASWTPLPGTSGLSFNSGILPAGKGRYYAYGASGIIGSADNFESWKFVSKENCVGLVRAYNGMFYKTHDHKVWRSTNQGAAWQALPPLMKDGKNYGSYLGSAMLQADDGKIYAAGAAGDFNAGTLFKSGFPSSSEAVVTCSPRRVKKWTSFSSLDEGEKGSLRYEFAVSTDRGAEWSGYSLLDEAGLKNTLCSGNGKDRLRVKITFFSPDHEKTPEVRRLKLTYQD